MLWHCPDCGQVVESDPQASDDWGCDEIALGPECEHCDEYMDLLDDGDGDGGESETFS